MSKNNFRRTSHQESFYAAARMSAQDHQVDVLISRIFDDLFFRSSMGDRPNNGQVSSRGCFCGFHRGREFLKTPLGLFNQILRNRYGATVDGMSHQLIHDAVKQVQFGVAESCFVSGNFDNST